jgi:hypothetical protein
MLTTLSKQQLQAPATSSSQQRKDIPIVVVTVPHEEDEHSTINTTGWQTGYQHYKFR